MPKKLLMHFMNNQSHQKYGISTRQTALLFGQMRTLGNFLNVISMQQSFPVQIEAIPTSKLNFPFLLLFQRMIWTGFRGHICILMN